jgi:hypothetical protein
VVYLITPIAVNHMASNNRMINDELINLEGSRDKALTSA